MRQDKPTHRGQIAIAVTLTLAVGAVGIVGGLLEPNTIPMKDFVEYWAAAVLNLNGGNPYDAEQLLDLQREATQDPEQDIAVMLWNPPWALMLVTPLGFLPAQPAHLLFVCLQIGCLLLSTIWLWGTYQGPADRIGIAWLLVTGFAPSLFLLIYGQISGLLLLGLAGFLHYQRQGRPAMAGAFAALTAIKPHLLFAFGLVLVLNALVSRCGRIALFSGAAAILLTGLAAMVINPEIYECYWNAGWQGASEVHFSPLDWHLPLVSYRLRMALNPDQFLWQCMPTLVVSLMYTVYWWKKRHAWHWEREMPMLVFASVMASAYGGWMFDLVVLLVPVLAVATRLTVQEGNGIRTYMWMLLLVSFIAVTCPQFNKWIGSSSIYALNMYIWVAPTLFAIYLLAVRTSSMPLAVSEESAAMTNNDL